MYELYDKNGNQIGYRMTKRIKNEDGKYDVLTARSKTSEKDCRKKLDDMFKEYYQLQEKKKSGGVFSEMKLKDYADNWYHLNIEKANCTQKNKYMYKNIVYNHIIEHLGSIKLCNLTEDDCQRFISALEKRAQPMKKCFLLQNLQTAMNLQIRCPTVTIRKSVKTAAIFREENAKGYLLPVRFSKTLRLFYLTKLPLLSM